MAYSLSNAVWEITYACNMRCKHCGSSCGEKYPDELTTEEALGLCDDLAGLGLQILTLSGGEPFLRKDWFQLAKRLSSQNVLVNAISNGWYITEELIDKARENGLVNIGVSLDGLKETHDFIRMKGSFERVVNALETMRRLGMSSVVCTSINKRNLPELPELYKLIKDKGVQRWQFQIASPMGNLLEHMELVMEPKEIDVLIDFCHTVACERFMAVDIADDIGYYNVKLKEIRQQEENGDNEVFVWSGCKAGKCVAGIRANGDITGCLSIRDDNFIEGNVRSIPLKKLWTSPGAFAWNREMTKSHLKGFCRKCQYGAYCLGGCTGAKLTLTGSLYENKYCSFRIAIEKEEKKIGEIDDFNELISGARKAIEDEEYQIAELYLSRAHRLRLDEPEILKMLGFVNFFLENYEEAETYNEKIIAMYPRDAYAYKGLGLCLAKTGRVEKGIDYLKQAISLASDDFMDPYYDLAVVLDENDRTKEAVALLEEARGKSQPFIGQSEDLYQSLKSKLTHTN